MSKVIKASEEYGAEEFSFVTIDEAGDTLLSLAVKAYLLGDGIERTFSIIPDNRVESGQSTI